MFSQSRAELETTTHHSLSSIGHCVSLDATGRDSAFGADENERFFLNSENPLSSSSSFSFSVSAFSTLVSIFSFLSFPFCVCFFSSPGRV